MGRVWTEEQKDKARMTRTQNKHKKENSYNKPILVLTGEEKDCFDVMPLLRAAMRKEFQYVKLHECERKITRLNVWNDIHKIHEILKEYVRISMKPVEPVEVSEPPKRRILSIEHLRKLKEGREKRQKRIDSLTVHQYT